MREKYEEDQEIKERNREERKCCLSQYYAWGLLACLQFVVIFSNFLLISLVIYESGIIKINKLTIKKTSIYHS